MFRHFKSIAHEKQYGYSYDSQAWTSNAPIESHFRMFDTYGDGLVQHPPDYSIQVEYLADYLASLAQAMLEDAELANELRFTIWQRPDAKHIAWAASVIYKAPKENDWNHKRTYFSAREMKLSKAPAKQYDKRYEEVRDIHDGSAKSIYRILIPEYADGMERYCYAEAIRDWTLANDGPYMELAAEFLDWFNGDRDKARELRDAYEMCLHITESWRLRASVEPQLENYKRRVTPKPAEPEPEAPAAAEPVTKKPEPAAVAEPEEPAPHEMKRAGQ
jgi:hypothetical protein